MTARINNHPLSPIVKRPLNKPFSSHEWIYSPRSVTNASASRPLSRNVSGRAKWMQAP